jgi:hypothetical protein
MRVYEMDDPERSPDYCYTHQTIEPRPHGGDDNSKEHHDPLS